QCEAEAQLDGREGEGDDEQERKAAGTVRHDRVQNTDHSDLNGIQQGQLQDARVLPFGRVERNVTTAGHNARVNRKPQPVRRLESQGQIENAQIARLEFQAGGDADAVDGCLDGSQCGGGGETGFELKFPSLYSQDHSQRLQVDWAQADVQGQRKL